MMLNIVISISYTYVITIPISDTSSLRLLTKK